MLTAERLRSLLDYDPESGLFRWKNPNAYSTKVGDVAGSDNGQGYLLIMVDGKRYKAHRLAWLYMTGTMPTEQIDHRNNQRSDNRFSNLREATNQQNQMNTHLRADNSSGTKGVSLDKQSGKWRAYIALHGKMYNLGFFTTLVEATAARQGAAALVFGEFAHEHDKPQPPAANDDQTSPIRSVK